MRYMAALLAITVLAGCGSSASSAGTAGKTRMKNHVHSIVIMPTNADNIYLGAHYHLYHSTNGGKSWSVLSNQMMLSMVMDPKQHSVFYSVSLQKGFEKSVDGAHHFAPVKGGPPKGAGVGVVVSADGKTVIVYGRGIYRSTDGGKSWTSSLAHRSVYSAAFGARTTVYAATDSGLYMSTDSGMSWRLVKAIGSQPLLQVAAVGKTAYAVTALGIWRTSDGGATWTRLKRLPLGIEFVGVAPSNPNEIFAEVGGQGFYASYNGGQTWRKANKGIHDRDFNASTVRVAPSTAQVAYTGAWGLDFYRTINGGKSWEQVSYLKGFK